MIKSTKSKKKKHQKKKTNYYDKYAMKKVDDNFWFSQCS